MRPWQSDKYLLTFNFLLLWNYVKFCFQLFLYDINVTDIFLQKSTPLKLLLNNNTSKYIVRNINSKAINFVPHSPTNYDSECYTIKVEQLRSKNKDNTSNFYNINKFFRCFELSKFLSFVFLKCIRNMHYSNDKNSGKSRFFKIIP